MNEDLGKLYDTLKANFPEYIGGTTGDEFVGKLSNRGEFTKWVNTVEDYLPGYFDGVNKQDVINRFHPLESVLGKQAEVRDAKVAEYTQVLNNTPAAALPITNGSASRQDLADLDFFQANRAAAEARPRADAAIRERATLEAFNMVPPDFSQFSPSEVYEFTHPGKRGTQVEHSELLSAGLNRRLDPDGKMTIVTGARSANQAVAARLTPTEIMNAKPGEIPGVSDERLLTLKQTVSDDDRIKQQQEFRELSLYSDVMKSQVESIPPEYFEAYKVLNEAVEKQKAGELDQETYDQAKKAQAYLDTIPEEADEHFRTVLQKTGELEQTLKGFGEKYPDVVLTDALNKQIQSNKDKEFNNRSKLGLNLLSVITSGGVLPGDLIANMAEGVAQAPGRLIGNVASSLESVTAPFDDFAAENMVRRSLDVQPDGSFRDASVQARAISEKVADFPYNGKTYQVGFNDEGKPTQVYDETGNRAQIPQDKRDAILAESSKGLATTARRQYNKDATFNAIGDTSSDLLGTMALTAMTGGLGAGAWVSRIRELGSVMLQYSGQFAEEAIKNGATIGQAAAIGLGDSVLEGATEAIFPFAAKITGAARFNNLKDNLRRIIQADDPAAVKKLAMKQFRGAITGVPMEGLEEDIAELTHPILNRAYNNFFDLELDTEAPDAHQLLESFALGAAVSVIPGLLGGIKNAKQVGTNEFLAQSIRSAVSDIEGVNKVIGDFKIPNTRDFQAALQVTAAQVRPYLEQKNLSEAKKTQIAAMTFAAEYSKVRKARVQSTPYEADLERQQKEAEAALQAEINSIDPNAETPVVANRVQPVAPLTTDTPVVDALKDVESTAAALNAMEGVNSPAVKEIWALAGYREGFFPENEDVAKDYQYAKLNDSNPELVSAVEKLLGVQKTEDTGTNSTQTTENVNRDTEDVAAEEDRKLYELSEAVTTAQRNIANAENPDEAIAAFNQAKQNKLDFENSIKQRKQAAQSKSNVAYMVETEHENAQKENYQYKDLYAQDPRLAILADLKDIDEFLRSPRAVQAYMDQGFSEEDAKKQIATSLERSAGDIADIEADLQETPAVSITADIPARIHEKLDNLPATDEGGKRKLTRSDADSTVQFARELNHPEVNKLLETYDKEVKKNKGKAFSNLYNGLRFVADVLKTPLTEQEQSDLNTVIQSQINARNANQPKRVSRRAKPVSPSGAELFQELYDVLRTVPASVPAGEGGSERFYSRTEQEAREVQALKAYADANGLMLPALAQQFPTQTNQGQFESLVYFDGANVVKAKANNFYSSWTELIESVQAQGEIFPETAYTVTGFTIEQGNFRIVATQPTIQKGFPPVFSREPLLAPNGRPSNLTPEQYAQVRTPEFKAWFGDWEGDPAGSSKVVDENGEPLVVYHRTKKKGVKTLKAPSIFTREGDMGRGIYFSAHKDLWAAWGDNVIAAFVDIRNPISVQNAYDVAFKNEKNPLLGTKTKLIKRGHDGVFDTPTNDQLMVFEPTQIKLAADNVGESRPPTIVEDMEKRGFKMVKGMPGDMPLFFKDDVSITDLHPENVYQDENGILYYIDPIIQSAEFPDRVGVGQFKDFFPNDFDTDTEYVEQYPELAKEEKATIPEAVTSLRNSLRGLVNSAATLQESLTVFEQIAEQLGDKELIDAINAFNAGTLTGAELENKLYEAAYTKQYERAATEKPIETGKPLEPVDPNADVPTAPTTELDNVTREQQDSINTVVGNIAANLASRLGIPVSEYLKSIRTVIVDFIPKFKKRSVTAEEYNKAIQTLNPAFREANAPGETAVEPMKVLYQEPMSQERQEELNGQGFAMWDYAAANLLKQKYASPKFQVPQFRSAVKEALKNLLAEIKQGKYTLQEVTDRQLDAEIAVAEANNDQQQVRALQNLKTNPAAREQYLNYIRNNQQESLDAWVNYVTNNHNLYDDSFRYTILKNVSTYLYEPKYALTDTGKVRMSHGVPVIEKWETLKRSPQTLKGFPPVFSGVVAAIHDLYSLEVGIVGDSLLEMVQRFNQREAQENKEVFKSDEKGEWIIFKGKETNPNYLEDAKTLAALVNNTPWCLKSDGTAKSYLESGDLYIYLTKDENGNFTVPRIGAAVNFDGYMREIRGIEGGSAQLLEADMLVPAEDFLKQNILGGEQWLRDIQIRRDGAEAVRALREGTLTKDQIFLLFSSTGRNPNAQVNRKILSDEKDKLAQEMIRLGMIDSPNELHLAWENRYVPVGEIKYYVGALDVIPGDKLEFSNLIYTDSIFVREGVLYAPKLKEVDSIEISKEGDATFESLERANSIAVFNDSELNAPNLTSAKDITVDNSAFIAPKLHTAELVTLGNLHKRTDVSGLEKVTALDVRWSDIDFLKLRDAEEIFVAGASNVNIPLVSVINFLEVRGTENAKWGEGDMSPKLTSTLRMDALQLIDNIYLEEGGALVADKLTRIIDRLAVSENKKPHTFPALQKAGRLALHGNSVLILPKIEATSIIEMLSNAKLVAESLEYVEAIYFPYGNSPDVEITAPKLKTIRITDSGITLDKAFGGKPPEVDDRKVGKKVVFNQDKRGAIARGEKNSVIFLSRKEADATTEIHEWLHEFEKVLTVEEREIVQKWAKTRGWTGKTSEAWAKGGELYLYEGKSDNPKMKGIFDKFREWLRDLFATDYFKDINTLTPEMRKIYDTVMSSPVNVEAQASLAAAAASEPTATGGVLEPVITEQEYVKLFEEFQPFVHDYTIVQDVKDTHEKIFNELYQDPEYTRNAIDIKKTKAAMYSLIENVIFDLDAQAAPFLVKVLNSKTVPTEVKRLLTRAVIEGKYFAPEILNRDFKPMDKALATIASTMMNVGRQFDSTSDFTTEDQKLMILNILGINSTFNNIDRAITQAEDSNIVPEEVQQDMENKTIEELTAEISALEKELKEVKEEKKERNVRINKVKAEGRKVLLVGRLQQEYGDDYVKALKAKIDEVAKKCK